MELSDMGDKGTPWLKICQLQKSRANHLFWKQQVDSVTGKPFILNIHDFIKIVKINYISFTFLSA